jgi:NADH-quinone oxidoreductase subunit N
MAAAVFIHPRADGHALGVTALLIYVVIYLFMNLGAFGVTAMIVWDTGTDRIEAFSGLIRRSPWLAIPMIVCLMSLVGIPPMAGFMGKWWILVALGRTESTLGWTLVVVAVVNTLISLYYYMRIVVQMALRDDGRATLSSPLGGVALVNLCAVALLVMFFWANPIRSVMERRSGKLFHAVAAAPVDADRVAGAIEGRE